MSKEAVRHGLPISTDTVVVRASITSRFVDRRVLPQSYRGCDKELTEHTNKLSNIGLVMAAWRDSIHSLVFDLKVPRDDAATILKILRDSKYEAQYA
mgnify:CR=1 FL=1